MIQKKVREAQNRVDAQSGGEKPPGGAATAWGKRPERRQPQHSHYADLAQALIDTIYRHSICVPKLSQLTSALLTMAKAAC